MKGKYIFESYKEFFNEYTKAKSDYDEVNDEAKRRWKIVHDSVNKYRKEFVDLFKSLKPDDIYHKSKIGDLDDVFYVHMDFNIKSKDEALSILERLILKFEDMMTNGYEMSLSVGLDIYDENRNQVAKMDTDGDYLRFEASEKYEKISIRVYLSEEITDDSLSDPKSFTEVISLLNKFEDMLEKGESVLTRDEDDEDE